MNPNQNQAQSTQSQKTVKKVRTTLYAWPAIVLATALLFLAGRAILTINDPSPADTRVNELMITIWPFGLAFILLLLVCSLRRKEKYAWVALLPSVLVIILTIGYGATVLGVKAKYKPVSQQSLQIKIDKAPVPRDAKSVNKVYKCSSSSDCSLMETFKFSDQGSVATSLLPLLQSQGWKLETGCTGSGSGSTGMCDATQTFKTVKTVKDGEYVTMTPKSDVNGDSTLVITWTENSYTLTEINAAL